ncbi:MAG: ATP-binding cassette domain-containing protein [Deltaproteobacteria bacterium]|nr:ATP-binding cassette domain-containing protein [Deltaproteobacteria bacterium]
MRLAAEVRVTRPSGFSVDARIACDAAVLGLVGPSGSGKSTILDAIAGIEPGARVVVDGEDWSARPLEGRAVGYVTQDALLFPHLSVRRNLTFSPRAGPIDDVAAALGIAHLLGRMPRHLSGGEARRVALARALVSRPKLLLLDEPFAGLDEASRRDAISLLDTVRRRFGVPAILVSHLADEVIGLTDWVVRLDAGRVVAEGPGPSVLRAGELHVDNYFTGEVVGPGRVRCGGVELVAPIPDGVGGRVRLACYAHDVLLASDFVPGLSARNAFRARVAKVEASGRTALVALEPVGLRALVTEEAVFVLGLEPGEEVVAIVKATSIAYLGAA